MNNKEKALAYEALLLKRGMRPRALRLHVLELLSDNNEFIDVKFLYQKLITPGIKCDEENIRYVIKRLYESGLIERRKDINKNKFLFRLRSMKELENDFPSR